VEHACEKCGAAVEDGRPFCPHCRAPQILVPVSVAEGGTSESAASVSDAASSPIRIPPISASYRPVETPAGLFDRNVAWRAALKAGALGGVIGMILPPVGLVLAGTMAVFSYRRERGLFLGGRIGWRVGGAAGAIAFAIDYVLEIVRIFTTHSQQQFIDQAVKTWQSLGVDPGDPGFQAGVRMLFTPAGMLIGLIFGMLVAALVAGLSGWITTAIIAPRTRQ
jgi:hypothetical protein